MNDILNKDVNTIFDKIENILWRDDGSTLIEFLESVIFKYPIMIPDISNIYVLVAKKGFPTYNFNKEQREIFEKNEKYVMGYIWLSKHSSNKHFSFINYIDTRINGLHLAKYMIEQYESIEQQKMLLPLEITKDASVYWKKYFNRVYDVTTKSDLDAIILDLHVEQCDINWNNMREILP